MICFLGMPFISELYRLCISHVEHMFDILLSHDSSSLQQFQGSEGMETHSRCSNDRATGGELDCLYPRPASSFEQSFGSKSLSDSSQSANGKFSLVLLSLHMMRINNVKK